MKNNPLVSVVMSVYNGEKYLREAIESILSQTYKNFEFIIIDDGSKDKSLKIINSYNDLRIKLYINDENKGLIFSLNRGIDVAKGKYIVRMDADDISLKERLELQVEYMEKNQDIALSGGSIYFFREENKFFKKFRPAESNAEKIKAQLFFFNGIAHPAAIIRNEILKKNNYRYNKNHRGSEDYGLWNAISEKYKIGNLKNPLIYYRLLKTSITSKENRNIENRYEIFKNIHIRQLERLNIDADDKNCRIFFEIHYASYIKKIFYSIKEKENFLKLVMKKNEENRIHPIDIFNKECAKQFYYICLYNGRYIDYIKSNFYIMAKINKINFYKSLVKVRILKGIRNSVR